MDPIDDNSHFFQFQPNAIGSQLWNFDGLANSMPQLYTFSAHSCSSNDVIPPRPFLQTAGVISPSKRLMEDDELHRSKIFASADRMADKMSLLRITNDEPIVNTETGKRLYFNTDINEIETVSMLPNFPFKINHTSSCMALIPWQPPIKLIENEEDSEIEKLEEMSI